MSRRVNDINNKIAYLTNKKTGPLLKTFRPLVPDINKIPKQKTIQAGADCQKELADLLECVHKYDDNKYCIDAFKALANCNKNQKDQKKRLNAKLLAGERVNDTYHPRIWKGLLKKNPDCINKKGLIIQRNLLNTLEETRAKEFPFQDRGRPLNKNLS